TSTLQEQIGW
nr:Chain C, Decapeptide: THR-SER-THR-LEU-GLN-GLU-GLN-ILE-GLY-TRP [synthetic construct]5V5L_E Chain E, TW10 [Human immunodeficiency virus 1]5V5L_F Chain F, TW10 [Human immunodeficiency virus 1]5V5M_E Chain E, TW10 [Human immunodeficiency virus 1]5V5M_F Chain F, TW10 [Human immunodeficiency virus 1]